MSIGPVRSNSIRLPRPESESCSGWRKPPRGAARAVSAGPDPLEFRKVKFGEITAAVGLVEHVHRRVGIGEAGGGGVGAGGKFRGHPCRPGVRWAAGLGGADTRRRRHKLNLYAVAPIFGTLRPTTFRSAPCLFQETPPGMSTYRLIPNADQTFHVAIVGDGGARQTILGFQTEADAAAWIARDQLQTATL
jgi:hypothetical protein